MTRHIFLFIAILQCFFLPLPAQISAPIVIADLQTLAGSWKGHLEYLDYRTDQTRVTLATTLEIKGRKNTLALFFEFLEPSGKKIKNKEIIRMTTDQQQLLLDGTAYSCIERKNDRGSQKLVLTARGLDNRRPATLRQTITMTGKQFRITKEVLPDGDTDFFVRNEYFFEKNTDITRLTFSVDMNGVAAALKKPESIGIRGSLPPLSWEKSFPLKDDDGDGIFSAAISFPGTPPGQLIEYKYVYGDLSWELDGSDNRVVLTGENNEDDDPDKWNVPKPLTAQQRRLLNQITPQALKKDVAILTKALTTLHPGLYRYQDEKSLAELFRTTDRRIAKVETLGDAYAEISRLTAAIRCGHTHPNPYNQGARVRQLVLSQADKIPFAFRLIDHRLIVTMNASDEERIKTGTEILAINSIPVPVIIDSLMTYSRADGSNDHKRLDNLQIKGYGKFEDFDILFPLLFPPQNGQYTFEARNSDQAPAFRFSLPTISRQERSEMLASRYDDLPGTYDDTWAFRMLNQATGYLQLGTFVTWNMEMDWKAFLSDAFHQLESENTPNLIIDIRGNEGGADEVIAELGKYLVNKPVEIPALKSRLRYQSVPADLRPYLSSWDDGYYDLTGKVVPAEEGFYKEKNEQLQPLRLNPGRKRYRGKTYLLVDAANSSATHILARLCKEAGLATLVGQPTGGNLRGINGGMIFFLRLPNTDIEVDIPLFASFPLTEQPDQGVNPDVRVAPSVEDIRRGVDTGLEAVLRLISESPK